ncbi:MAG: hypothetical protein R3E96_06925, partial [Planctomycetota bacterium]
LVRDLHRVSQAWGEGNSNAGTPGGGGTIAQTGDATWLHTFYNASFWTTPGGDFDPSPSASVVLVNYGRKQIASSGTAADVQDWLDNPAGNFGWVLKDRVEGNSSAVAISSREDTFPNSAPTLVIEFSPPGGTIQTFCDPAAANSTGVPTVLAGAFGSGVGSDLHLEATSGPPTQFGYFLVGSAAQDPGVAVGGGFLCLSQAAPNVLGRYNLTGTPLGSIGSFDAAGVLQNLTGTSTTGTGFDVPSNLPLPGSPTIAPGSTWFFQLWHREPGGASNFSNAVAVSF